MGMGGVVHGALRRVKLACRSFANELAGSSYARRSYAQYGEDMVIRAILARFPHDYRGFYVDVGAHHPLRFSNTYAFYEVGWCGICIDPSPLASPLFAHYRPRDIFVNEGVSESGGELTYYMYDEPALNTFSEELVRGLPARPIATRPIQTNPLKAILERHLARGQVIDFLTIDTEGFEFDVIRSIDLTVFRPRLLLLEDMTGFPFLSAGPSPATAFLSNQGYVLTCRLPSGLIFLDERRMTSGDGFLGM